LKRKYLRYLLWDL